MQSIPPFHGRDALGSELVRVGRIRGAQGIRGQVKVEVLTDFLERFSTGARLQLQGRWVQVEGSRWHQGRLILKLAGIDSRTEAEALLGEELSGKRSEVPTLDDDEFLTESLVGLTVMTSDGAQLGKVDDVLLMPAHDVLQVGQVLIPFVKEFIKEVNTDAGTITVELIDGMVEADVH